MKSEIKINRRNGDRSQANLLVTIGIILMAATACKDFVEIDPPETALTTTTVFENKETATASLMSVYVYMTRYYTSFVSGETSLTTISAMAGDELINHSASSSLGQFAQNAITADNSDIFNNWNQIYSQVYTVNAIIEGVEESNGLTPKEKDVLIGEAKFLRAFFYFYLVNYWGDVPLITSTDYVPNATIPRTSTEEIYQQIIADLKEAQQVVNLESAEKIRPNQHAATALLARVYLYREQWAEAEAQASLLLNNAAFNIETDLNNVFLKESVETIWQLQSIVPFINTWDGNAYVLNSPPYVASLNDALLNAFETGDARRTNWVNSYSDGAEIWYYPYKYKVRDLPEASSAKTEYLVVLRLGEQLLIRSEARAHLGDMVGAKDDLNRIRSRAGLPESTAADLSSLLTAIEHERQLELLVEWGHRWLDLKRTNQINTLANVKSDWQDTDALFPLPQQDLDRNQRLTQNPGY